MKKYSILADHIGFLYYKNDSFLKNVYVRFNESMFTGLGISTVVVTPSGTSADCTYDGVRVELIYSVK